MNRLPHWVPFGAILFSLTLAWLNFLLTAKWAELPGALNGPRRPLYAAALLAATVLAILDRREIVSPKGLTHREERKGLTHREERKGLTHREERKGLTYLGWVLAIAGFATLAAAFLSRLPLSTWGQLPFKDDWTPLFQQAVNGVGLMRRGSVVGWNWWLQGGYPTSTDIAQSFAALAIVPMSIFGDRVGYHVLHAIMFFTLPLVVWWDIRQEDRETAIVAGGFAALFTAGYFVTLGNSGDTNSLAGVFCAALALVGSRAARLGRRWGGPVLLLGLTLGLYSHVAFVVYALLFLGLEAVYYRDRRAAIRLVAAAAIAGIAALPVHWESLRYPGYVSFNNTVYDPRAVAKDWGLVARTIYYNVEILAFPHRWFNDYRSLANVWLPALAVLALLRGPTRTRYYAWAVLLAQGLLRLNTPEAGAGFDRIQHMFPLIAGPAFAGIVTRLAGTRRLALALSAVIGLYVATSFVPIRHVPELRAFDPPLIDRIAAADGNMILVEISPHRDMDKDPVRRTQKTPFDVHFEGLLPEATGHRFYSQMIDGWVWNIWRGEVVGAGTFMGQPIAGTPVDAFVAEMHRWGVRHLFVWTDESRDYLARSGRFSERWRGGRWSHFELLDADTRSVVTASGSGRLGLLDFLGATVDLADMTAGEPVVVRAHYYPAWRAFDGERPVALHDEGGQLAFLAPRAGSYTVRLAYPRYHALTIVAALSLLLGGWVLSRSSADDGLPPMP